MKIRIIIIVVLILAGIILADHPVTDYRTKEAINLMLLNDVDSIGVLLNLPRVPIVNIHSGKMLDDDWLYFSYNNKECATMRGDSLIKIIYDFEGKKKK